MQLIVDQMQLEKKLNYENTTILWPLNVTNFLEVENQSYKNNEG